MHAKRVEGRQKCEEAAAPAATRRARTCELRHISQPGSLPGPEAVAACWSCSEATKAGAQEVLSSRTSVVSGRSGGLPDSQAAYSARLK